MRKEGKKKGREDGRRERGREEGRREEERKEVEAHFSRWEELHFPVSQHDEAAPLAPRGLGRTPLCHRSHDPLRRKKQGEESV